MTADNEPEKKNASDKKGEVRPSAGKHGKLEDKIADEKDDELLSETAAAERKRDS
jgi:hypothetical protein